MTTDPATDRTPSERVRVARGSRDHQAGTARRGRLGFSCSQARRIVRPIDEIEDDDQCLDQRKAAAHE